MQKLSQQEKEEINRLPNEDLHCLKSGMLYTKDVNYYMDYLKQHDEKNVQKNTRKKAITVLKHWFYHIRQYK